MQPRSPDPRSLVAAGDTLYFVADPSNQNGEKTNILYKLNPPVTGVFPVQVEDFSNGATTPSQLVNLNGTLLFVADFGTVMNDERSDKGLELWKYDGTDDPEVIDIFEGEGGSGPVGLTVSGNHAYFIANGGDGKAIFQTDGVSVRRLTTENVVDPEHPLIIANGKVYFQNSVGKLMVTDTDAFAPGESEVVRSDTNGSVKNPEYLVVFNNTLYFAYQPVANETWSVWRIAANGKAEAEPATAAVVDPEVLTVSGNVLFFTATQPEADRQLWAYDLTNGMRQPLDFNPNADDFSTKRAGGSLPQIIAAGDGRVAFVPEHPAIGREVWVSDGTGAGTFLVRDVDSAAGVSSNPRNLVYRPFDNSVFFVADNGSDGIELWQSVGRAAWQHNINEAAMAGNSDPARLTVVGDRMYFVANDGVRGIELWVERGGSATLTQAAPNQGPLTGGTEVILTGTNLGSTTAVRFDGVAATSFTIVSDTQVKAIAPARANAGQVDIALDNAYGTISGNNTPDFTYLQMAALGPAGYQQNFNTLTAAGGSGWADGQTLAGWHASISGSPPSTVTANNGTLFGPGLYSDGLTGSPDRALGISANGVGTASFGVWLMNTTGSTINSLTISYWGEQWSVGNPQSLPLAFAFSTTATSLNGPGFTGVAALDFAPPRPPGPPAPLDGNVFPNRVLRTATITGLNLAPGQGIWLRWTAFDLPGTDPNLAIDDLVITAS